MFSISKLFTSIFLLIFLCPSIPLFFAVCLSSAISSLILNISSLYSWHFLPSFLAFFLFIFISPALFLGWKNYVKCELLKIQIPVLDLKGTVDQNILIQVLSVAEEKELKSVTGQSMGDVIKFNINESDLIQSNINESTSNIENGTPLR